MTTYSLRIDGFAAVFRRHAVVVALMLAAAAATLAPAPAGASEASARRVAQSMVDKAHGALSSPSLSEAQKFSRVESAVRGTFAFSTWEKFLLGDSASQFSRSQLSRFRKLLPKYLARLYMNQFGKGLRQKPEIGEARTVRGDVLVRAKLPRSSGGSVSVDWRVRGGKVIDFMVGGTSFLVLKRAEFRSTINRGGPDTLNDFLERFATG